MKIKTSNLITWVVAITVMVAAFAIIVTTKKNKEKILANKYQDVKEDVVKAPVSSGILATEVYKTEGGNDQENDNFFVKGKVNTLTDLIDKNKEFTVVWISASWCEICHAMRPFVSKSMNKFAEKIAIKEIDFDSNRSLVSQLGLYGTPVFIAISNDGREIKRWGGATQSNFESLLEQLSKF